MPDHAHVARAQAKRLRDFVRAALLVEGHQQHAALALRQPLEAIGDARVVEPRRHRRVGDRHVVGELLEAVESLIRPQLTAKELEYDCSGCDSTLLLRGDRQKTVQILLNILSNAVKFTPPNGRIAVRTSRPSPGRAVIAIRDTGIGMTAAEMAAVFEPFVQFDNSLTRQEKGTGLGMLISRELARGMDGELAVESEPGIGTEFLLTLSADCSATADPGQIVR